MISASVAKAQLIALTVGLAVLSPRQTTPQQMAPSVPTASSLTIAACGVPRRDFVRIGWGEQGLQFEVPLHSVKLHRGNVGVDYVVHRVTAKNNKDHVEFWFGPMAFDSEPDRKLIAASESTTTHEVLVGPGLVQESKGGVIGKDVSGRLRNGTMWRHAQIGTQGAVYENVSPENAATFDRIIDSACWIPEKSH